MTQLQWIGAFFVLLLIGFLFYAYLRPQKPGPGQRDIIRFICSLCAGFAGGLFVGSAMFKLDTTIGATTKFGVTGAAGFAFAFAVWYGYGRALRLPPGYIFRVPPGWKFRQAAEEMVKRDNGVIDFSGFTEAEANASLREAEVSKENLLGALEALGDLAESGKVRPYSVSQQNSHYTLSVKA
jgi:hypothetical protein